MAGFFSVQFVSSFFSSFLDETIHSLSDNLRSGFDSPATIFKSWVSKAEKSWKSQKDQQLSNVVCLASIVKLTYSFCMSQMPQASPVTPESAFMVSCFLGAPVK